MPNVTQNRLATIGFRWSIATIFVLGVFASLAPAQAANLTTSITGVYNGTYAGTQGPTKFKLSLTEQKYGTIAGEFTMYMAEDSGTNAYTCDIRGRYVPANRMIQVLRGRWQTPPPRGIDMPGMSGVFDPDGGNGAGQISGKLRGRPGPEFQAIRDAAESAAMADAVAATNAAGEPANPVASPERRRTAVNRAAPPARQPTVANRAVPERSAPPPTPRAPGAYPRRSEIDGVYAGTYGSNPDDQVTAKLYVKFIDNGSVNGTLDGMFTFDVPPSAGAKPITYTYKLIGVYATGTINFWSAKPVGSPAPAAYAFKQIYAEFDRAPFFKGPNGQLEVDIIPDQITAKVTGTNGLPNGNKIAAKRDPGDPAQIDSLMAAAEASAASAVSATAPAAVPGTRVVRPNIVGVFNGTYTRANEPPTKFKLTITQTGDGLAGIATIYLPTEAGTKAYTYRLNGAQVPYAPNNFELKAAEWETTPPSDFKNFRAMGFNGEFRSNLNQNTARIVSVPESAPSVAANPGSKNAGSKVRPGATPATDAVFYVPKFEATWDEAESADIKGTIAAQEAVGNADQIAALKAHAEVVKNAKPKQLASKYLVRKSQAYWDGYRSDFIREVFDGGFASDVDDDPAFQSLFIDYVDLFSKNCAAYFPASHQPITITTTATTTYPGGAVDVKTTSKTVEIDTRFIQKYCEYSGVEPEPGSDQAKEQTAKTIAIVGYIFHAGGPSHGTSFADAKALLHLEAAHGLFGGAGMEKFFAAEVKATGPSAALRQMGENLLRGATGEPSLQEAGARIAGAEAETDQNLPPGRFAHLVDAAHAFYREPGNARLESRFETAFDETLAAKYRGVMTPDEEYYYANDFEGRFRGQIMQPRAYCQDPEWPRLHPAVEECVAEVSQ